MSTLQKDSTTNNHSFTESLKKEVSIKLEEGEGNQIQFTFNSDLITDLQRLQKRIPVEDSTVINILSGIILSWTKGINLLG